MSTHRRLLLLVTLFFLHLQIHKVIPAVVPLQVIQPVTNVQQAKPIEAVAVSMAVVAVEATPEPTPLPSPIVESVVSGSHEDWLRAALIGPQDWDCANNIIMGESGWNVHATNPSSGAYGIPQSLPASKMAAAGPDWQDNPVTQLIWMKGYVAGYGGFCAAWEFKKCLGNCYSPRTHLYVFKKEKWY